MKNKIIIKPGNLIFLNEDIDVTAMFLSKNSFGIILEVIGVEFDSYISPRADNWIEFYGSDKIIYDDEFNVIK